MEETHTQKKEEEGKRSLVAERGKKDPFLAPDPPPLTDSISSLS